jgi:hypothetical protein
MPSLSLLDILDIISTFLVYLFFLLNMPNKIFMPDLVFLQCQVPLEKDLYCVSINITCVPLLLDL